MIHARLISALAAAALLALPGAGRAADVPQLKFAFPASLQSDFAHIIVDWQNDVNKAEDGKFKIKMFPGGTVANFGNVLDRIQNGVVDIGFGIFGPYSRQFPQTFVVELPFVTDNSTECSTAMWRLKDKGVTAAEYEGFHPLALFCFTGASLQSTRPVRSAEDMKGLKIGASGKVMADDLKLMGAAPVTINPSEFFEALNRGLAQGVLISWPGAMSFKLQDVAKYHMSTPFGLFPAFVGMNKGSYARLSADAKAQLDKLSGETFSKRIGVGLDKSNDETIEMFRKMKGHEVIKLSDAELKKWDKILEPVTQGWVKATPDGAKVLSSFRAELQKIRSGS